MVHLFSYIKHKQQAYDDWLIFELPQNDGIPLDNIHDFYSFFKEEGHYCPIKGILKINP